MVLGAGWLLTLTASHNWAAWGGRGYTGQGAPSLHSQRQRIPATTTAVPTRLLTRCPQNMLKTPIYAQNSKMYQNIKYAQPHNIIPPKSGVRSQPPALPDDLLEHCDPKPWGNTIRYQDPPLPTRCQRNSTKPKSAKNRVPTSRASQGLQSRNSGQCRPSKDFNRMSKAEGDVPDRTEKNIEIFPLK